MPTLGTELVFVDYILSYILKDIEFFKKFGYYANVLSIRVNCSETLGVISFWFE